MVTVIHLYMGAEPGGHTDGKAAKMVAEAVELVFDMLYRKASLLGSCYHFSQGYCCHLAHLTPTHQTDGQHFHIIQENLKDSIKSFFQSNNYQTINL